MRNPSVKSMSMVVTAAMLIAMPIAFAQGEKFVGTWTGTWDGAGSGGGFDLTIERDAKGMVAAKVAVTGEPSYTATLKTIAFDGSKMTGTYDFPPDPSNEIRLAAAFDGGKATGTWALHEKAGGSEVIAGNWNVAKK